MNTHIGSTNNYTQIPDTQLDKRKWLLGCAAEILVD